MSGFESTAKLIVGITVIELGEESVSVKARKMLIENICKKLKECYEEGQEDSIDLLFPETNDYTDSPIREWAIKTLREQTIYE